MIDGFVELFRFEWGFMGGFMFEGEEKYECNVKWKYGEWLKEDFLSYKICEYCNDVYVFSKML